jgi:hypothetical protein
MLNTDTRLWATDGEAEKLAAAVRELVSHEPVADLAEAEGRIFGCMGGASELMIEAAVTVSEVRNRRLWHPGWPSFEAWRRHMEDEREAHNIPYSTWATWCATVDLLLDLEVDPRRLGQDLRQSVVRRMAQAVGHRQGLGMDDLGIPKEQVVAIIVGASMERARGWKGEKPYTKALNNFVGQRRGESIWASIIWRDDGQAELVLHHDGTALPEAESFSGTTAEELLDSARPDGAELHGIFEWDDRKAAEAWRLDMARRLLNALQNGEEQAGTFTILCGFLVNWAERFLRDKLGMR